MKTVCYILLLLFAPWASANEVDNITHRWDQPPLSDSAPAMDDKVNAMLKSVVIKYNSPMRQGLAKLFTGAEGCDSKRLASVLQEEFHSNHLLGAFEFGVEASARTAKSSNPRKTLIEAHGFDRQNIYRHPDFGTKDHVPAEFYVSAAQTKIPLASSINVDGHYIGTDKFGHFFDQGWDFFKEYQNENEESLKTKRAMGHILMTEQGTLGLAGTGIYSFGDLAADLSGGLFWMSATQFDMTKQPTFIKDSSWAKKLWEKGPLFRCENGKIELRREFHWKDYVTDAWDEGLNCVDFSPLYDQGQLSHPNLLRRNIKKLESQHPGQRFQCPVEPSKCEQLKANYGSYLSSKILSSECGGVAQYKLRHDLKTEACWYTRHYKSELADFNCSDIPKSETEASDSSPQNQ